MSNTCRLFFFLIAVYALHSCVDNFMQEREVIHRAEQTMQEQPDSALHLLQGIDRHSLRGEALARYALVYSIAQDKSGLDVSSDSLLRIAYEYYCQHPEDSLYARSQYYMGKYLWITEQTDSAYSCLLKARTVSEAEKDYYTAYLATDRMRKIVENSDTALCLSLSKEAYWLYVKHGADNPVNEAFLLRSIGDSYRRRGDKDSTLYYYNEAFDKAKSSGDSLTVGYVLQNISYHYWYNKQYDSALDYAQKALGYQGGYNMPLLKMFALCYIENAEYDKARQYINAIPKNESQETQLIKLSMQHRISARTGDADAAQACFDSACDVAADMYLATQKDKFELHRKNMQETMERQQAEHKTMLYAICMGFSVVLILFFLWLFVKYHQTKRKEIAFQKEQNRLQMGLYATEEERFHLEEAKLRQESVYKEHLMEQTRSYVKKIVNIQHKLMEKKGSKNRLILDAKDWNEIQAYLEACDGAFVTRFKEQYPSLSEKDYQLCLLLRYGFTNPDLELVYIISPQAIKTRQRLLKNKLGIMDKDISLRQFVREF